MNSLERLFTVSACVLLFTCLLWAWRYLNPEWLPHQKAYRELSLKIAKDDKEKAAIAQDKFEIKQLDVTPLKRVDRCTTCHRGYDKPNFSGVKEPLAYHPYLLDSHPPQKFGCTVCHNGQGRATTKAGAFGRTKFWKEPLFDGDYIQASCGKCHFESYVQGAPLLNMGKQLYTFYGCNNCHKVFKQGGSSGPDLTKVSSKQVDQFIWGTFKGNKTLATWFSDHFKNSQVFQPTSKMSDYAISDENAKALTIYMLSLTEERFPPEYYVGTPPWAEERSKQ